MDLTAENKLKILKQQKHHFDSLEACNTNNSQSTLDSSIYPFYILSYIADSLIEEKKAYMMKQYLRIPVLRATQTEASLFY